MFRYNNLAFEAYLASSQQFQHCRHPGCDSGGSYDPNQTQWTLCEVYAGRTCVQCDLIWDDGHSCVDVAARRAANEVRSGQEAATLEYLSKETKDCPKCGYHTEKSGGCDHMRCESCVSYLGLAFLNLGQAASANTSTAGSALQTGSP